ncbi:unnamed protein product [Orchesella dallaii]|uniref:C2H2-type domain-containing protein n=1 Tax=Orchesella dallaii TaxID=48710 RepID=A0ABP1QF40_9HEXA
MNYQEEECLFCEEICSGTAHPSRFLFSGSRYLGKDCPSLESQLKQLFILRRILNIPSEWCEEKLGGSDGVNPSNWFGVCGGCSGIVEEAVDVHHKILKLESKFQELKEKVKDKMGSGRSKRRRRRGGGGVDEDIKEEIRRMVVVGEAAIVKSEVEKSANTIAEFYDENDDDFNLQQDEKDDDSDSESEWNEENIPEENDEKIIDESQLDLPKITKRKGPGRPPRGEERPRDVYLTKDGKVRRYTFHWLACSKCPAKFKHREDLEAHISLHDSSTNQPCPECFFPCKNNDELERHQKAKHEGHTSSYIPRYGCVFQDCKFATYSHSHLHNHCGNEHPSMSPSELKRTRCPPCTKTFGNTKSLALHQRRMHPELFGMEPLPSISSTSGPIQCNQCGLKVTSQLVLDSHVRNTHERVQRHICEECGKGFKFKCHLESHMIVHRKEREFVCQYCGLDYPAKQTLATHIKKIHSENVTSSGELATKEEGGDGPGGEDSGEVFSCKYCELTSPFKAVIRRHLLTHKVEMGHKCDICQKCYTSDAGLKRHVRINHPTQEEVVECPYCKKPFGNKDYMNDHLKKFCQVRKELEAGASGGGEQGLVTPISSSAAPPLPPPPVKQEF